MELLLSLVISAMVMGAALAVHQRMQQAGAAVLDRIHSPSLPSEVLALIREDLDKVTASPGTRILIDNKREKGYPVARLILRKTITDKRNAERVFEEIIWQATYDIASDRVTLYRSHSGLVSEDRLLDRGRRSVEAQYPFVPVCGGLTAFTLKAPQGVNVLERWASPALPTGVQVTLSFADPIRTPQGELAIAESDQITQMMAVDRTRMIRFEVEAPAAQGPDAGRPSPGTPQGPAVQDPRRPGSRSSNAVPTR